MLILITGHEGFIGRHFAAHYRSQGHTVIGIDLKNGDDCRDFFRSHTRFCRQFDLVVHCAAVVGGRALIDGAPITVATDLAIDAEFFNWVVATEQPRVVYFSSSAAYPTRLQNPGGQYPLRQLFEGDVSFGRIDAPDMTYGWAKLTGEYLASFARKAGTKVHVFRPFSGYGHDQDLDYPFPSLIRRVQLREDPFEIWGDGDQIRDFIHVDDIVGAVEAAIAGDVPGPVNLASGVPTSFNELAERMFHAANWWPDEIRHLTDKPVGVRYRVGSPRLMESFYTPTVSLDVGIDDAFGWRR